MVRVSLCSKVQFNKNRLESLLPARHWARQQEFRYKETQAHSFIGERAHGVITDTATTDSVLEGGRRELRRGRASKLRRWRSWRVVLQGLQLLRLSEQERQGWGAAQDVVTQGQGWLDRGGLVCCAGSCS